MTAALRQATRPAIGRSRLLIALLVSVGLNLLLGGLVLQTRVLGRLTERPPFSAEQAFQDMASRLPEADSAVLRDALGQARPELHRLTEAQRATHDQIKATLSAPSFDPAALRREMQESRDQRHAITDVIAATLQQALEAMSADGRAAFARNYGQGRAG